MVLAKISALIRREIRRSLFSPVFAPLRIQNTNVGNDTQHMTSIEMAELTGKQHKNVMQAIRNMEPAWEKVNGLKIQLIEYQDLRGRMKPCYQLTKTECLYIATKFNDEAHGHRDWDKGKACPCFNANMEYG